MCRAWLLTLLTVAALARPGGGSNVLGLFPHFGYSHFKVFYPVLRGLAERGHNVTVVTYIASERPPPNYEELLIPGKSTVHVFSLDRFTPSRSLSVLVGEFFALHHEGQESCERFYQSGHVQEILRRHASQPYDLVVTEFFNTDCYLGVPDVLGVPVVGLSSCALMPWYYDRILLPDTPSHVQSEFIGFPEQLSWQQRLLNFIQARLNKLLYTHLTNRHDNCIVRKYLGVDLDVAQVARARTSLVLVNQHYSLSGSRPLTPQLKEIGGVHVDEREAQQSLPAHIERFLRESPEGVLFISWGSMVRASSIDATRLGHMVEALKKLSLRVVWKWEDMDRLPTDSEDFLFLKWAPQLTLLCHPKVKLFWAHGGLLGVTEAAYCGTPVLVTPIYGDQFLNGYAVQNRRVGRILNFDEIDQHRLQSVLMELQKPRYAENAATLARLFRHRETTPLATALWWIEHLLRHGESANVALRTKAVDLNWFVYYSLDSVALLLLLGALPLLTLWRATRFARAIVRRRSLAAAAKAKKA